MSFDGRKALRDSQHSCTVVKQNWTGAKFTGCFPAVAASSILPFNGYLRSGHTACCIQMILSPYQHMIHHSWMNIRHFVIWEQLASIFSLDKLDDNIPQITRCHAEVLNRKFSLDLYCKLFWMPVQSLKENIGALSSVKVYSMTSNRYISLRSYDISWFEKIPSSSSREKWDAN